MTHGEAGKGDGTRPFNRKRYGENYERIFGEEKPCPHVTCTLIRRKDYGRIWVCDNCEQLIPYQRGKSNDS